MKKTFIILFLLLVPFALVETVLRVNMIYKNVSLLNYSIRGFQQASSDGLNWPDVLIMGSSVARQDVDPQIIQSRLKNKTVGSLALVADSISADYYTLARILATCKECPSEIIYVPTDTALKNHETNSWKDITDKRILNLYFENDKNYSLLVDAAEFDPNYAVYLQELRAEKVSRTYFVRKQLLSVLELFPYSLIFTKGNISEAFVKTKKNYDGEYGFYSFPNIMDRKTQAESLSSYKGYLANYAVGGATGLYFNNFLKLATDKKIKIYIAFAPLTEIYRKTFTKEFEIYKNYVDQVSKDHDISEIDDSSYISDNKHFFDVNHLNKSGSIVYSNHLGEELSGLK